MIKFSVPRLDKEPIELSGEEPIEFLGLPENDSVVPVSGVRYELKVDKVSGGALVTGSCAADMSASCGRCLAPVDFVLAADEIEIFLDLEGAGEEVDISEDVRTELLLELPMNVICFDDCRGLCPVCGADLNKEDCSCCKEPSGSLAWGELDQLKL